MEIIKSFFLLLFGGGDTSAKQRKVLREIAKEIGHNRYRNFYSPKEAEIRRHFGVFFYDLYKGLYQTAGAMHHAEKSSILKQVIVERFLSPEGREALARLAPECIDTKAKTENPQELAKQLEDALAMVSAEIKSSAGKINRCYRLIAGFARFARFDFFSCLKKLDGRFKEGNAAAPPQFRPIPGKYAVQCIKEFLSLPFPDASAEEWKTAFAVLKAYKPGAGIIDPGQWKKLFASVKDVLDSKILVLMIRHIDLNPEWDETWEPRIALGTEDMAAAYLREKNAEVAASIGKLMQDKRLARREGLAKKLFGDSSITRLQHYTNAANDTFLKKNLPSFVYIGALNYMGAFFTDRHDIRDLCDMFVIRGHWTTQELSRQASKELHEIADVSEELKSFDEALSEKGVFGSRIKNYLAKPSPDKTPLKSVVDMVNTKAYDIITHGIGSLTALRNQLKALREDAVSGKDDCIVNWKELQSASSHALPRKLEEDYAFVEDLVSLLRLFVSEE